MNTTIVQSLVWALVHSLWQAAAIFTLYVISAKLMSKSTVNYRYLLSTIMLGLIPCTFVVTALLIDGQSSASAADAGSTVILSKLSALKTATTSVSSILTDVAAWIDQNLLWAIRLWLVGTLVFMLRILTGVTYLYMLRKNAL